MSIVFDRAVAYYDQTRALDPNIMDKALDSLVHETGIARDSRVLEIGIGTGRIAMPMSERIPRIYGVDLSMGMMGVLQDKLKQTPRDILIAQANVLQLPFDAETFDLVYGVHVLHLVSGWQNSIADAWRVLKPGGHFAVNFHRYDPEMPNSVLRRQLREMVAEMGINAKRPGAQSEEEVHAELSKWDPTLQIVNVAEWSEPDTPAVVLKTIDSQTTSETWIIPRPVMDEVMPKLTAWALEKYKDLDQPFDASYEYRWLIAKKA